MLTLTHPPVLSMACTRSPSGVPMSERARTELQKDITDGTCSVGMFDEAQVWHVLAIIGVLRASARASAKETPISAWMSTSTSACVCVRLSLSLALSVCVCVHIYTCIVYICASYMSVSNSLSTSVSTSFLSVSVSADMDLWAAPTYL